MSETIEYTHDGDQENVTIKIGEPQKDDYNVTILVDKSLRTPLVECLCEAIAENPTMTLGAYLLELGEEILLANIFSKMGTLTKVTVESNIPNYSGSAILWGDERKLED